jgi:hypothetical protein
MCWWWSWNTIQEGAISTNILFKRGQRLEIKHLNSWKIHTNFETNPSAAFASPNTQHAGVGRVHTHQQDHCLIQPSRRWVGRIRIHRHKSPTSNPRFTPHIPKIRELFLSHLFVTPTKKLVQSNTINVELYIGIPAQTSIHLCVLFAHHPEPNAQFVITSRQFETPTCSSTGGCSYLRKCSRGVVILAFLFVP